MPKTRPPYPPEFRQQIVELARAGRTIAELSREFGCSEQTIRNWIGPPAAGAESRIESKPNGGALSSAEREELVRLRRELKRVQMERDILAKATAWFAAKGEKTSTPSSN
jgi:transposase